MAKVNLTQEDFDALLDYLAECEHDPELFVQLSFPWGEEGTPLENKTGPEKWQLEVLREIKKGLKTTDEVIREAVSSGHGIGKAHRLGMVVDTPNGYIPWGDIGAGDYLFGADGNPVKVIATRRYKKIPFYRVTFDDGTSCEVSSGHLWTVKGRKQRRNKQGWITMSTLDILNAGVKRPNGVAMARKWEIPQQKAASYQHVKTDLHPYLMGVWLGDGSKNKAGYTKPDSEVKENLQKLGYEVTSLGAAHYIRGIHKLCKGGVFDCRSYERYIPDEYVYNDIESRKALLCGLMDSDGECHKNGSMIYNTTSRRLADDVLWLVRSLGGKAQEQPTVKVGKYNGKVCRDCYRLTITLPFNPFSVKHKADRYKQVEQRYLTRWIESIEYIGDDDGMCVQVENQDGLYLANDFIVTHNSAMVSWLILWALGTKADTRGVVTANTEAQLRTKTWAELSKWYQMWIAKPLFTYTATSIYANDPEHEKTWKIDCIPWSVGNSEAFAGLHNQGNRILLVFDEASAIENIIWDVAEGALTDMDTEIMWVAFGNPTQGSGRFYDCFHKHKHLWNRRQVDSRTVSFTNKKQIEEWRKTYGEDSDFFKIRVRGEFPSASDKQFIPAYLVDEARRRSLKPEQYRFAPVIIALDPSWGGADKYACYLRQGLYTKFLFDGTKNDNDLLLAQRLAEAEDKYRADAVFIDLGYGTGIKSAGEAWGRSWTLVAFGGKKGVREDCLNKRAEMWQNMKEALEKGLMLPENDTELADELTSVERKPTADGRIQLESKEDMKKRGVPSPNRADALAMTFAHPVLSKAQRAIHEQLNAAASADYDPFKGM